MMDIQSIVDAIALAGREARGRYHLTLGQLHHALICQGLPSMPVVFDDGAGAGEISSYRGYYDDCAISDGNPQNVLHWRGAVSSALATTFVGYKGGNYPAHSNTPLWRSEWGEASGVAIIGTECRDGKFVLITKKIDD